MYVMRIEIIPKIHVKIGNTPFKIPSSINNNYKQQLDSLLASYELYSTITFATRVCCNTSTALDNIFINKHKNKNYIIYPWINGLSDHDGQNMTVYNVTYKVVKDQIHTHRIINESSILDFQINLSYELWDDIFIVM
jgi:hypothetical protein